MGYSASETPVQISRGESDFTPNRTSRLIGLHDADSRSHAVDLEAVDPAPRPI
jgi:hypothetical protein